MEKLELTPSNAANLSASYLSTATEGEEQIRANKEQYDSLVQQIGEHMLSEHEGDSDPTRVAELVRQATALGSENIQLRYSVDNADARARTLYEHKDGNAALREAALGDAALAGVHINVEYPESKQ